MAFWCFSPEWMHFWVAFHCYVVRKSTRVFAVQPPFKTLWRDLLGNSTHNAMMTKEFLYPGPPSGQHLVRCHLGLNLASFPPPSCVWAVSQLRLSAGPRLLPCWELSGWVKKEKTISSEGFSHWPKYINLTPTIYSKWFGKSMCDVSKEVAPDPKPIKSKQKIYEGGRQLPAKQQFWRAILTCCKEIHRFSWCKKLQLGC